MVSLQGYEVLNRGMWLLYRGYVVSLQEYVAS